MARNSDVCGTPRTDTGPFDMGTVVTNGFPPDRIMKSRWRIINVKDHSDC